MTLIKAFNSFKTIAWFVPGFLLYAAFPPMGETADILFALAPLLWLSRRGNVAASVRAWTKSGILFWITTLSWMPAIVKNGGPWPLVVLGWFALAAYCTVYFAAFGYLSAAYWRWATARDDAAVGRGILRLVGILFVEPVLWCGLELVRSRFGGGFAWNQLGVVPANTLFGSPAAFGGVYLLSAVVILINGSIAGIAERVIASARREQTSRFRSFETLLVFGVVFAIYRLPTGATEPVEGEPLTVSLVQRNFPCCFSSARRESPVAAYSNLLAQVSFLKSDLVVLPESAMSEFGALTSPQAFCVADWMRRVSGAKAVLAGGGRCDLKGAYNSAALFQSEFSPLQVYDKVHLVPFGEFIPGDKIFPVLQKLAPVGSCTPGRVELLSFEGHPFGTAICYEDTDSALCREFAARGAEFLVFITNDSWFSKSNEAWAHAWQATARAIETGLPVVRVGNSGVTGVIDPSGERNWLTDAKGRVLVDRRGVMTDRIRPRRGKTMYTRLGDIPLASLFLLLIGAIILVKYKDNLKRKRFLK